MPCLFVCLSACLSVYVCLSLCQQDNSKTYGQIVLKFFRGVEHVTSNSRLDLCHDVDMGASKRNLYQVGHVVRI